MVSLASPRVSGRERYNLSTGRYRTPNTAAAKLTATTGTWAHAGTTQAQVVAIAVIERSRRTIVAVATSITRRRRREAAGVEEVIRITSEFSRHNCTSRSRTTLCCSTSFWATESYTKCAEAVSCCRLITYWQSPASWANRCGTVVSTRIVGCICNRGVPSVVVAIAIHCSSICGRRRSTSGSVSIIIAWEPIALVAS